MVWDKPIRAGGHEATAEQAQAAWDRWVRLLPDRAGGLQSCLIAEGAGNDAVSWRCARIADRMLQKARREGYIEFAGGRWRERKVYP